jgi:hypothetical protein
MRITSQNRDFSIDVAGTVIAIGFDGDEAGNAVGPRVKVLAETPNGKIYALGEYATETRAQSVFNDICAKMGMRKVLSYRMPRKGE